MNRQQKAFIAAMASLGGMSIDFGELLAFVPHGQEIGKVITAGCRVVAGVATAWLAVSDPIQKP